MWLKSGFAFSALTGTAIVIGALSCATPAVAQAQEEAVGVGDIMVTAQRRTERLQDVPIAVSAFSGEALDDTVLQSSGDLTQITPGLNAVQTAFFAQPTIRGVGTFNTHVGDENGVATYVDGVYISQMIGGFYQLANIDRIEVLKGPQGTLFGRNATGGAINIITATPTPGQESEFSTRVDVGNFALVEASAHGAASLSDTVAGSLSGYYTHRGDYIDNVRVPPGGDFGERNNWLLRGKLLWAPSDNLSFTLIADSSRSDDPQGVLTHVLNRNSPAEPAINTAAGDYEISMPVPSTNLVKQNGVSLQADLSLSAFDVVSVTAFRELDAYGTSDSDASAGNFAFFNQSSLVNDLMQEIRLVSKPESRISWVAGVFAYSSAAKYNPLVVRGGATTSPIFTLFTKETTLALAAYADVTIPITDQLSITGGIRYSDEEKEFRFNRAPALAAVANGQRPDVSFDSWTPRAVLSYRPNENTLLYASYSQGFKSGGYNTSAPQDAPYRPEEITAYEIGAKLTLSPGVILNAAVFSYDYQDLQVQALTLGGTASVTNATTATMQGFDADLVAQLTSDFSIRLGAAYLDASYDDFPNAGAFIPRTLAIPGAGNRSCVGIECDVSGNQLPRAPEWTFNAGANWENELASGHTLAISGNIFHSASYPWEVTGRLQQDDYTLVNAQVELRLPGDQVSFAVWGKNLTDDEVFSYVAISGTGDRAQLRDPLTYGVSLKYRM